MCKTCGKAGAQRRWFLYFLIKILKKILRGTLLARGSAVVTVTCERQCRNVDDPAIGGRRSCDRFAPIVRSGSACTTRNAEQLLGAVQDQAPGEPPVDRDALDDADAQPLPHQELRVLDAHLGALRQPLQLSEDEPVAVIARRPGHVGQ